MAANLKQKAREMENNNGNRKQGIFGFMTD